MVHLRDNRQCIRVSGNLVHTPNIQQVNLGTNTQDTTGKLSEKKYWGGRITNVNLGRKNTTGGKLTGKKWYTKKKDKLDDVKIIFPTHDKREGGEIILIHGKGMDMEI